MLLVPPGIDFVTLVFALFKVGAVTILIDPGMGRMSLLRCLAEADPEGFIAIPFAHAVALWCEAVSLRAVFTRRWVADGSGAE